MASTIGVRISADVSQAKSQLDTMSSSLEKLTVKLKDATDAGNWKDAANITNAIDNIKNAEKAYNTQSKIGKQAGSSPNNVGGGIVNNASAVSGAVAGVASGNYAGAAINMTNRAGSNLRGIGGEFASNGNMDLGKIIGAAGVGAMVLGSAMAGGNALSEQYENSMGGMNRLNKMLGSGSSRKTASQNNDDAFKWFEKAKNAAAETGMLVDDFMESMADTARYGLKGDEATKATRDAALWANYNGSSLQNNQNLIGISRRYGDNSNVLQDANAGLVASGMQKGQSDEFLNTLQKVIEDGISNGYIKTAKEVATQMTMFSKLSGNNALWQGEQGQKRIQQLGSSLSNATNLQTSNDVMLYEATKKATEGMSRDQLDKAIGKGRSTGDSYIDTSMLMERGMTPEILKEYMGIVQKQEGKDNIRSQIERIKQLGFNTAGARDIQLIGERLLNNEITSTDAEKAINSVKENPNYVSDETKKAQVLNEIKSAVVGLGKGAFNIKIEAMDSISNIVKGIYDHLLGVKDDSKSQKEEDKLLKKTKESKRTSTSNKDIKSIEEEIKTNGYESWKERGDMKEDNPLYNVYSGITEKSPYKKSSLFLTGLMTSDSKAQDATDEKINDIFLKNFKGSEDLEKFLNSSGREQVTLYNNAKKDGSDFNTEGFQESINAYRSEGEQKGFSSKVIDLLGKAVDGIFGVEKNTGAITEVTVETNQQL
ncbi:MAG: hypothetical protein ACRC4W_00170 [Treponemataceae bacterium]